MKLYILLLAMITFAVMATAEQIDYADPYMGYAPQVMTQFVSKTSSATSDAPFYVGRSTKCVTIQAQDREVWVTSPKSNTKDIFWGFEQTISTMNATPGKVTIGNATLTIAPDTTMKFEKFYGNIYLLNEDLNISSSTVIVTRYINIRKTR